MNSEPESVREPGHNTNVCSYNTQCFGVPDHKLSLLPYGVGTLSCCSTAIVQHIYGAIQEYAGFEEPRWLD